jgi:hypothetical protein
MIWASIATPPSPLKQHEWFPAMTRGIPIESTDPKIEGASQSSGLLVVAVDRLFETRGISISVER